MQRNSINNITIAFATGAAIAISAAVQADPPPNDECANATHITVHHFAEHLYLDGADEWDAGPMAWCESGAARYAVWYKFRPSSAGWLNLMAQNSGDFAMLSIFEGSCNSALAITCAFQNAQQPALVENLPLSANTWYLIKLSVWTFSWQEPQPHFNFDFYPLPANETCDAATAIDTYEFVEVTEVFAASAESCDPQPNCMGPFVEQHRTVWYQFQAPVDGVAIIHTQGSTYDTAIALYNSCPVDAPPLGCLLPAQVSCANDPQENGAYLLQSFSAGQTYKIKIAQIGNAPDVEGDGYWLNFNFGFIPTGAPMNDLCSSATLIAANQFNPPLLPIDHAGATANEPQESCESGGFGVSNSVFYKFVPESNGTASINTFGSTYDTVLSVFNGCGVMLLPPQGYVQPTLLACNNDVGGLLGNVSAIGNLPMLAGNAYIIKVAGNGPTSDVGQLDFNFQFTPGPICQADIAPSGGDGTVDIDDLLAAISAWGPCASPCPADIDNDGSVDINDLLAVISAWGPCP